MNKGRREETKTYERNNRREENKTAGARKE